MSVKTCTKCKQKKPLDDFRKHPNTADGRHTQCRQCLRAYSRAYYHSHKKEKQHETTPAPHRPHTPRHQPTQATNEVAVMSDYRMTPGEAADRLRKAEQTLHYVYHYGGGTWQQKKRLKDIASQIDRRAREFESIERKTRNALA